MNKVVKWLVCLLAGVLAFQNEVAGKEIMNQIKELASLEKDGNWTELTKGARALLEEMDADDHRAGWVWSKVCNGLIRGNAIEEYDELFEKYTRGKFAGNLSFLVGGPEYIPDAGFVIDNKFRRGGLRGNGGRYVTVTERDRIVMLAALAAQLPSAEDRKWNELPFSYPEEKAAPKAQTIRDIYYLKMANLLLETKNSGNSYKLQVLTDLTKIPDYDSPEYRVSSISRPPVNEDGSPVFYQVPDSWENAASDGERLRFVLERAMRSKNNTALMLWADFLCGQFDFLVAEYRLRQEYYQAPAMRDFLYGLKENETVAELVDGTRKITLPEEFNYISMYKKAEAHSQLAEIYASRMQFEKAAAEFDKCGNKLLADNLRGAFGRPDSLRVSPAWADFTVPYHFRNARTVTVKLYRVDSAKSIELMLEQLKKPNDPLYIWSLPYYRHDGGQKELLKLIGDKPEIVKTFTLEPLPHFWEKTEYLKFGKMEPGAFVAEFIPDDNKQSRCDVMFWLANQALTIQQGGRNGKNRMFLNDPLTGAPIPDQKISVYSYYHKYERAGNNRSIIISDVKEFQTDGDGIVEFSSQEFKRPEKSSLTHRFALSDNSRGKLTLLEVNEFGNGRGGMGPSEEWRSFIIADKTVYKPGDAIAFTGYLRTPSYSGFHNPADLDKVTVKFRDPQNKEAITQEVDFDRETQSFTFEIKLPADAMLGRWNVSIEEINAYTSFSVEEYKKPEYLLTVTAPPKPVVAGEKVPIAIEAKYYFGAPLAETEVRYKVFREETTPVMPFVFAWNWLYGFRYAFCTTVFEDENNQTANFGRVMILDTKGLTDASGRLTFEVDSADAIAKFGRRNFRYTVQAEVNDSTNRVVSGSGSVIAAVRPFEVSVYMPWGFARTGQRREIQIAARTANGTPVKGQGTLRIYRKELNADGVPKRSGEALIEIPFIPDGPDKPFFIINEAGVYEMVATVVAENGAEEDKAASFIVTGEKQGEKLFGEYPLSLSTDKPEYQPGDEVKLLISCDQPNRTVYLVTRSEREGSIKRLTLDGYTAMVTIPVKEDDQPNFFVEAFSYQNGRMLTVKKQIVVPPEKKILSVSAEPAVDKVKPGTVLPLKITVTGLDGKPVSGAATVTVYDKSLEAINPGVIPQIQPYFWNWVRWSDLGFMNNFQHYLGNWNYEPGLMQNIESHYSRPFHGGMTRNRLYGGINGVMLSKAAVPPPPGAAPGRAAGGMGGAVLERASAKAMSTMFAADVAKPEEEADMAASSPEAAEMGNGLVDDNAEAAVVRTNFLDRAFWAGRLDLPESGEMTVEIPVPDNLTTWVVRVWSLTPDTRVGEARTEIVVSKDLIARLELPRFMTQGDVVNAVVSLNNTTEADMGGVTAVLSAPGLLATDYSQTVEVKAGRAASFEVPLQAAEVGEVTLTLRASSGSESDALELKLPVLVKGIDKQVNNCGRLDTTRTKTSIVLDIPQARKPETTGFALYLSPGAAKNMMELLPYLAADDSGDIYGVVSRFMPALLAKLALQKLGIRWEEAAPEKTSRDALYAEYMHRYCWNGTAIPSFTAEDFDRVVAENLRMVKKMVNSDGGWGWFGAYREQSWADTTSYVVDALLELREAQYGNIDDGLISGGVNWLKRRANERIFEIKEFDYASNTDCLMARVLAKAGAPNRELMSLCYERRVKCLAPYGMAMLALAYEPGSDEANMLIRNLEQFLKVDDENLTAYLNIPSYCCYFWYGNENETLAAYLELLLRDDANSVTAQKVANYLVTNVRNSPWRNSTRSLGAAVRALAHYIVVSGEGQPDFTVTVKAGDEVQKFAFNRENMWKNDGPSFFIPAETLEAGTQQIELEFEGQGALYWNSMLNYFSLEDIIEPAGLEMKIQRNYYRLEQDMDASALLAGQKGSVVRESVLKYRRVPLKDGDVVNPGDLIEVELISTAKNDYDYVVFQDAMPAGFEFEKPVSGWIWQWAAPMYAEYKERGARFYLRNMARGQSNVFYRIRAQLRGTVTALPPKGYGVYAPELKCNGAQHTFQVE